MLVYKRFNVLITTAKDGNQHKTGAIMKEKNKVGRPAGDKQNPLNVTITFKTSVRRAEWLKTVIKGHFFNALIDASMRLNQGEMK